jgi:hypothetical protein
MSLPISCLTFNFNYCAIAGGRENQKEEKKEEN